jgi:hypothetical protein
LTEQPGPSVDECHDRLHRAGWSFGWTASGAIWPVTGSNGENTIKATGGSLAEAYWRACLQARA